MRLWWRQDVKRWFSTDTRRYKCKWSFRYLTPGGVNHAIQSIGRRCRDAYQRIIQAVRNATAQVTCDETGWRIGGKSAWLHAAVTPDACAYLIDAARGKSATDQLLGENFAGQLNHDGWRPYDRYFHARHQQCNAHVPRRCDEMIEVAGTTQAVRFPAAVQAILRRGLRVRDQRDAKKRSLRSSRAMATRLSGQLRELCQSTKRNQSNERLARFCYRHADALFAYLEHPGIDATNWRGEHAMRYAVVNRKVWGGNRTRAGADIQAILTSILYTLKLRGIGAIDWLQRTLLRQNPPLLS
jgi:transposase